MLLLAYLNVDEWNLGPVILEVPDNVIGQCRAKQWVQLGQERNQPADGQKKK